MIQVHLHRDFFISSLLVVGVSLAFPFFIENVKMDRQVDLKSLEDLLPYGSVLLLQSLKI